MHHISFRHDADALVGWEVHFQSWGYLLRRALALDINLSNELARIPRPPRTFGATQETEDSKEFSRVGGRILINMWKVMRHQVSASD